MKATNFPILMIFLACLLFASCSNNSTENPINDLLTNETPELLQSEDYPSDLLGSFTRKRSTNVIDKLYEEALGNEKQLNELNNNISNIFSNQYDSLKSFEHYSQVNYNYWMTANNLLSTIGDSILRNEAAEIFTFMQSDYEKKIKPFINKRDLINERSIELGDRKTILKLMTTLDMINKYQSNELPDINQLDNLIASYDQLIAESVEQVNIKK